MTRFQLQQLVCDTLDVMSYRIGLQYEGRNKFSEKVMDILDDNKDSHILTEEQSEIVENWIKELPLAYRLNIRRPFNQKYYTDEEAL